MSSDAFKQYLAKLSAEYRSGLPGKLAEIDALGQAVIGGGANMELLADLQRKLHTLAGSAKTFGFPAVSTAARAAENFLDPICDSGAMPGDAERGSLGTLLDALGKSTGSP